MTPLTKLISDTEIIQNGGWVLDYFIIFDIPIIIIKHINPQ